VVPFDIHHVGDVGVVGVALPLQGTMQHNVDKLKQPEGCWQ
jgi:hypothetical protein